MKKHVLYYTGNFLMVASFCMLIFIYYPFLQFFIPQPEKTIVIPKSGFFIVIPKIAAFAPVIPNIDPWNKSIYAPALEKGVAQAKGTALPGEKGTIFLFAHSSDYPWKITRSNIAFFRLGELHKDNKIQIYDDRKEFDYIVRETKVVWPNEVSYLVNKKTDQLILQTCTPVGTALQRLLVFADPSN